MKLEKELTYNQPEFNLDKDFQDIDKTIKRADDNLQLLKDLARKSLEKGHKVLGGFFGLTVADGRVFYQVTEIKKNGNLPEVAFVKRCAGICFDLYEDDILGQGEWIALAKANDLVNRNRALEKLFGGK